MKCKLSVGVSVIFSLALVLFGLLFGTARGFDDDRKQVDELLHGESGLLTVLSLRGADAMNLRVVALRHLEEGDEDVAALFAQAQVLRTMGTSLITLRQADEQLETVAQLVAQKLLSLPEFQQNERDAYYVDMLLTDMKSLARSTVIETYNQAAIDFNSQLQKPISGNLARLVGIKPCEVYP